MMATTKQVRKLYDGEVELTFSPTARNRYTVAIGDESFSPVGCTTVIDKMIGKDLTGWAVSECLKSLGGILKFEKGEFAWYLDEPIKITEEMVRLASKAHTRRSDYGKSFGSAAHEAIESLLLGEDAFCTEEAIKAVLGFARWFNSLKNVKILATEQIVYSREYKYAGTFDILLEIDGRITLCDIKTTNISREAPRGIYAGNFIQLGGYRYALEEERGFEGGDYVHDLMVVACHKDGSVDTLSASELGLDGTDCMEAFLSLLKAYAFLEPLKKIIKEGK